MYKAIAIFAFLGLAMMNCLWAISGYIEWFIAAERSFFQLSGILGMTLLLWLEERRIKKEAISAVKKTEPPSGS